LLVPKIFKTELVKRESTQDFLVFFYINLVFVFFVNFVVSKQVFNVRLYFSAKILFKMLFNNR